MRISSQHSRPADRNRAGTRGQLALTLGREQMMLKGEQVHARRG